MRGAALLMLCSTLGAQTNPAPDAAFFKGDPRQIMIQAADKAWVKGSRGSRNLARWGEVYLAGGERTRAEDAFRRALQADPEDPGTHALVAMAWLQNGFIQEGLAASRAMPKKEPRAAEWLARLAGRLLEKGLELESQENMEISYRLDTSNWRAFVDFGRIAVKAQKLELAGTWFYRAVLVRPRDEDVWTAVALAYAGEPN